MADHCEALNAKVIGQLLDVACPALIASCRVKCAVTVTRPIRRDKPCSFAGGDIGKTRKVIAGTRRSMEGHYGRAVAKAVLDPRQFTTIRKVEHSGVGHPHRLPGQGRLCERRTVMAPGAARSFPSAP